MPTQTLPVFQNFEALRRFALDHHWQKVGDEPIDDYHVGQRVKSEPEWPPENL